MSECACFALDEVLQSLITASVTLAFHAFWMVEHSAWLSVRMVVTEGAVIRREDCSCAVVESAVRCQTQRISGEDLNC